MVYDTPTAFLAFYVLNALAVAITGYFLAPLVPPVPKIR